ncbi:MAG: Inositol 2-dehydrogenase/D-chiro-inositol 3-dehydrogenase [Phycisphaerae bacterium]|nr:Inositol 2-dehydrogenase/D-chiro-inositol 3-dehydrogenase [Phycisphaerae bacterium]
MARSLNIALIGQKFMGRAHSNAWLKVARFFQPPVTPVMYTVAAREAAGLKTFARRWGWQNCTTDWRSAALDPEVHLVDVGTPNHVHAEQAIAALEAGKHVACEKPLAGTLADARAMRDAARAARRSRTFVWYNYRRCPAVALAHRLVREGRLGRIFHVRACYLQSWAGPAVPLLWRFQKKFAGSGAHGDLNAHIVDMARFITGQEITEVCGAVAETFIKQRAEVSAAARGGIAGGTSGGRGQGRVDVDDAVLFLTRFAGGAVGSFEATRFATGNQNNNTIEVNGEKGALRFAFEDMNLLWFYDAQQPPREAGWRRIMCTSGGNHPYADAWWPDAHVIGYEHGFVNMAADILNVIGGRKPVVPLPDFADAYQTQRVLEAALLSARHRSAVKLSEVK